MAPLSTLSNKALIRRFLTLADPIACRCAARWQRMVEPDAAQQIARLTLVSTALWTGNPTTAPTFIEALIHGGLHTGPAITAAWCPPLAAAGAIQFSLAHLSPDPVG